MRNELEKVALDELRELHYIIDEVMKIPDSVFKQFGISGLALSIYESGGAQFSKEAEEASLNFDRLCQSVPNIPRKAIRAVSLAYGAYSLLFDPRVDYCGDFALIRSLMGISSLRGMAMGVMVGDPSTTDSERKKLLSMAGSLGAQSRQQPYAAVKDWALKQAVSMCGADVDIARKLAAQLPRHLAEVSKNPERLIYDALRTL